MSIIRRFPNPEHMARCAAAIRERWANEATFQAGPVVVSNVVKIGKRRKAA